jgi:hypothetical protein
VLQSRDPALAHHGACRNSTMEISSTMSDHVTPPDTNSDEHALDAHAPDTHALDAHAPMHVPWCIRPNAYA